MEEAKLLKISLICIMIGMPVLLLISQSIELSESNIAKITDANIGKQSKVEGIVKRITAKESFSIIDVERTDTITVVAFDNITLRKGDKIIAKGKLEEYQDDIELVADEIRLK